MGPREAPMSSDWQPTVLHPMGHCAGTWMPCRPQQPQPQLPCPVQAPAVHKHCGPGQSLSQAFPSPDRVLKPLLPPGHGEVILGSEVPLNSERLLA